MSANLIQSPLILYDYIYIYTRPTLKIRQKDVKKKKQIPTIIKAKRNY